MDSTIISSKAGSLFHPMVPVLLLLGCVPAFSSGQYIVGAILLILVAVTWILDRNIKVDLANKKYRDGPFNSWVDLPKGGYLSIFTETSGVKMQSFTQSTQVTSKELRLNFIQNRKKVHIYTAKGKKEADAIAIQIAETWDIGVYDALSKEWIKEDTE